ncbi:hypothetical protein [Microbacterium sp. HJ5]
MALSAVFPLLMVTIAIEHRRVIRAIVRGQRIFDNLIEITMGAALVGLVISVIGVQLGELATAFAVVVWICFGVGLFGVFFILIGSVSVDRDEHDKEVARHVEEMRLAAVEEENRRQRSPTLWQRFRSVFRGNQ